MKCLEKDRTRRYETANGLAADLKRHLSNEPVVARPPSTAYRFQKAFRRNKLVFTAATAVAAALVLGIAVSAWLVRATRQERAQNTQKVIAAAATLRNQGMSGILASLIKRFKRATWAARAPCWATMYPVPVRPTFVDLNGGFSSPV
jgi:hypothetical protein